MPINHRSKHIARSKYSLITNKAGYFGFCSTQLENDYTFEISNLISKNFMILKDKTKVPGMVKQLLTDYF